MLEILLNDKNTTMFVQNRNEIGNIKIITNLLTEYYSHLKGYLKRKLP